MTRTIQNDNLIAIIDTHGAELISVKNQLNHKEYIWSAKPDVWKRHAPVLFPVVGKYKNGVTIHNGQEYKLPQHGFARDMEFEVVSSDGTSVSMKLTSDEKTKEVYPFDFELYCIFSLSGNTITASWKVVNKSDEEMYFSIGGHPAFVDSEVESLSEYKMKFDTASSKVVYHHINTDGLRLPEEHTIDLEDGCETLTPTYYDLDALIVENSDVKGVSLLRPNGDMIVDVKFDCPVFGLWSAAGKNLPFLCIEPWYGRTDADTFSGELKDREFSNHLAAGETFDASYTMSFGKPKAAKRYHGENNETMADFAKELEESYKMMGDGAHTTDALIAWESMKAKQESGEILEVEIIDTTRGGAIAEVEGLRAFIPISKLSLERVENINDWMGKTVRVQVEVADMETDELVLSARNLLKSEANANRELKMGQVQIGDVMTGKVANIVDFGAFIDLDGGLSGLVHISQISLDRIKHPSQALKEGQDVRVKVIDKKDGKLSLSIKVLLEEQKEEEETSFDLAESESIGTSFADLLKNIKL